MTKASSPTLSETTLARLRALAKGNGLEPEAISIIEQKEAVYTLPGLVHLTSHFDIKTRSYKGRSQTKNGGLLLPSFAALQEHVDKHKDSFEKDGVWIDKAVHELKTTKGHGWGQHDAFLTWSGKATVLVATENCPACNGTAQHPCPDCQGLGVIVCQFCEGRGKEICYQCNGRGEDPVDPTKPCPLCHGERFVVCRYCHHTGKLPCPSCQGQGHIPCKHCQGTGVLTREAHITDGARLSFSMTSTSGLPSGLLRAISRLGEDNLPQGHADIILQNNTQEGDTAKDKTTVLLQASLPYADLKMRFGGKSAMIACAGKNKRLFGVPTFLDEALIPARRDLARAAKGAGALSLALKPRLLNEALGLILIGKTHPNELRRLYPVGLSGEVARQIMDHLGQALKAETRKDRILIATLCLLLSGGLFGLFLFTDILPPLTPMTDGLLKGAFLLLVLGIDWLVLSQAMRWLLKRKFPSAPMAHAQPIGRTGYGTLAGVAALYASLLALLLYR